MKYQDIMLIGINGTITIILDTTCQSTTNSWTNRIREDYSANTSTTQIW